MNCWNRIFHNKRPKIAYFAENLVRYLWPRRWLRTRLDEVLRDVEQREDWPEIEHRVSYYIKLQRITPPHLSRG